MRKKKNDADNNYYPASKEVDRAGYERLKKQVSELERDLHQYEKELHELYRTEGANLRESNLIAAADSNLARIATSLQQAKDALRNAKIIECSDASSAGFGDTVKYQRIYPDGTVDEEELATIVSASPDFFAGEISKESPIGLALFGKKANDETPTQLPGGRVTIKVLEIIKAGT